MKNSLTPEDKALWEMLMKGVDRLKKEKTAFTFPPHSVTPKKKFKPFNQQRTVNCSQKNYQLVTLQPRDLKNIVIDGYLDLHGYTLEKADQALNNFIASSQQSNRRWVLIITGKGLHSTDGRSTLKKFVQEWFNQNTHFVIGFSESKPQHGGTGAFYVKIRRLRG